MFRRRDRRDKDGVEQDPRRGAAVEELDESESDDFDDASFEDEPEDMSADLESQAADYLAGNDLWMYGPSADVVLEILDRLEEITPDEARPIAEAWLAIPKSDREQARKSVRKIYETDPEMARHLQMAREAVGTWMAVKAGYPEYVNSVADWARICTQTGEAALDAATAVILEETLEEGYFEALYTPWSETTAELDEAAEAAGRDADVEEDAGEDEVAVDTEDEVAFGPNAVAVADFLNRLWLITPEQVGRLVGGWQNAPRDELSEAHAALQAVVDEDPVYRDQVRNAQEKLAPWLNSGRIQETSSFLGQSGQGESRKMAGPALADAIAALVVGDLLDPVDAETLYAPWYNLIAAPPLPEPAADEKPKSKAGVKATAKAKTSSSSKSPAAPTPKPAAEGTSATSRRPATTAKVPATTAKSPATTAKSPATTAKSPATTATAKRPAVTAPKPAAPAAKPARPAAKVARAAAKPAAPAPKPAAKGASAAAKPAPAANPAAKPKTSTATPEAKAKPVAKPNAKPTRK